MAVSFNTPDWEIWKRKNISANKKEFSKHSVMWTAKCHFFCVEVSSPMAAVSKNGEVEPTHFFILKTNCKAEQRLLQELWIYYYLNELCLRGRLHLFHQKMGSAAIYVCLDFISSNAGTVKALVGYFTNCNIFKRYCAADFLGRLSRMNTMVSFSIFEQVCLYYTNDSKCLSSG